MKAIVQDRFGPPDTLQLADTGRPEAGPDDVLVRVHAAALNPADWHILRGDPLVARLMGVGLTKPKARVAGVDAAGVVEAAGANVRGLRNSDQVGSCSDLQNFHFWLTLAGAVPDRIRSSRTGPFQVIRPWPAEFAALLGEHAAYLVHTLEIAVAEAIQPVADFRFQLEVIQGPYLVAHGWSGYLPSPTFLPRC